MFSERSAATLRHFMEFFRILTGSLQLAWRPRGGEQSSQTLLRVRTSQDRGITLGLHYVISELYNAVSSVLDSYLVEPFHFDQSKKRY